MITLLTPCFSTASLSNEQHSATLKAVLNYSVSQGDATLGARGFLREEPQSGEKRREEKRERERERERERVSE